MFTKSSLFWPAFFSFIQMKKLNQSLSKSIIDHLLVVIQNQIEIDRKKRKVEIISQTYFSKLFKD
jgi:hypothetical protein